MVDLMTPTQIIAVNIRNIRNARKLSGQDLVNEMQMIGSDITRSVLANFENGRVEDLGVNRLAHFAQVLKVDPWSLATLPEPICLYCHNAPPPGFGCNNCGLRTEWSPDA
jgi:transcriptional regulator with XRE-family HTH domain